MANALWTTTLPLLLLVASPSRLLAQTAGVVKSGPNQHERIGEEESPEPPSEDVQPQPEQPESDEEPPAQSPPPEPPGSTAGYEDAPPRSYSDTKPTDPDGRPIVKKRLLNGFRVGYSLLMNSDETDGSGQTALQKLGAESPHNFLIGYELIYRMIGHSWLNVLLVGNVLIGGLEQSKFFPSVNFLVGFEFENTFQLGLGINLTPERDKESHMILAAGWTPLVGSFYVPVHFFFIPDVDTSHRTGITVGVTF